MTIDKDTLVGAVAANHPLATRVFARHGIDFCCGGGKPISEVCAKKGIDADALVSELRAEVRGSAGTGGEWTKAPLPSLIDHIVRTYHASLKEELPRLEAMAQKVVAVHGEKMPEALPALLKTFQDLRAELEGHMMKEEQVLFPMIVAGRGEMAGGPISVMEQEHAAAGAALERLRELTDDYTVPEGACNTWRALWLGLEALESDLHAHIHLENNILFPRALTS